MMFGETHIQIPKNEDLFLEAQEYKMYLHSQKMKYKLIFPLHSMSIKYYDLKIISIF